MDTNNFDTIYKDNQSLINSIVNKYKSNYNYLIDDLKQIADIALWDAYNTYDSSNESNAKFETYATTLINNKIKTFIKKENKYKNISNIDELIEMNKEDKILSNKLLLEVNADETADICISDELYAKIIDLLNTNEIDVFNLLIDGYTKKEICEMLKLNTYRVNKITNDIREKCSKLIKKYNK